MPTYTIYTRSRSEDLYNKMSEFLPKDKLVRVTGFNGYNESVEYLFHIINDCKTDYIVNIDEDCFIYDFKEVEKIIIDLEKFGLTHAGMSDFGACPHRNFRPETHNPFFNVIKTSVAKQLVNTYNGNYFELVERSEETLHEPFDLFFLHLKDRGKHYNLGVDQFDEISTELIHNKEFCIHTWYSREYETDEFHNKRINEAYEYARNKWKLQN